MNKLDEIKNQIGYFESAVISAAHDLSGGIERNAAEEEKKELILMIEKFEEDAYRQGFSEGQSPSCS